MPLTTDQGFNTCLYTEEQKTSLSYKRLLSLPGDFEPSIHTLIVDLI